MQSFTLQSKMTFAYSCTITINFGLNLYNLFNLVPRALFPSFGWAQPKAREKRPGDEVVNITLLVSKRRMNHDLTDLFIKSFRFPDNFAPLQASHSFKLIAIVQYSGGLGSSAPTKVIG